jgi:hypothetical protein
VDDDVVALHGDAAAGAPLDLQSAENHIGAKHFDDYLCVAVLQHGAIAGTTIRGDQNGGT